MIRVRLWSYCGADSQGRLTLGYLTVWACEGTRTEREKMARSGPD